MSTPLPTPPRHLLERAVRQALQEDLGMGDLTSQLTVPPELSLVGAFVARESGVVCGLPVVEEALRQVDAQVVLRTLQADGARVHPGQVLAEAQGNARSLLAAERVALNFLQRLSGIATLTARFVEAVEGTQARIVDTRKTTPGLRFLEKYAVRCGGGHNHRMGLYDAVMIKDNHIVAAGGISQAVRAARAGAPHTVTITVECDTLNQVEEALAVGVDCILLDNMTPDSLRHAVTLARGAALLEASGGVRLENVRAIAETGVDLISVGALTHSAPALDIAFDFRQP